LQFEVVARLTRSIDLELVRAESLRATRERPNNPDALDLSFHGEAILRSANLNQSAMNESISLFERALALDPQNRRANVFLATALAIRADNRWSDVFSPFMPAGAGAMLVACRLAGLSALETHYAGIVALTQLDACGSSPSCWGHNARAESCAHLAGSPQ